jgi:hypothetical protein
MISNTARRLVFPVAVIGIACVALSLLWGVPYIFTLIGLAAWAFVGHLVTADDDAPGGWSNPDGKLPFPWAELGLKAFVLVALGVIAIAFPIVRSFGGTQ